MSTATIHDDKSTTNIECAHCGLPSPPPRADQQLAFCCRGCRGAYELIRGWGLEEYYELRSSPGGEVAEDEAKSWSDFDDPRLLGLSAPLALESVATDRLLQSTLAISGIHCAACGWLIERAPERIHGWHSARVNMHARTVQVTFDPTAIALSQIAKFLHRIGYTVHPRTDGPNDQNDPDNSGRELLIDLALAAFCAANAMWIAVALYAGQFTGMAASHWNFLRIAGVGLGVAAVVFPGRVFFRSALASIRTRTPHMDLPVAVGLLAGTLASLYGLMDASREVYFDSIACLVLFLLSGRWLQMRQQRRAGEAVAALMQMSPAIATRIETDGTTARVSAAQIVVGDRVLVHPGESIPVDGEVSAGHSVIDRSLMTGESCPVSVSVGTLVEAGTDNLQSDLTLIVTATGEDTKLAAMKRAVADAAASRTPIVQLANRIGAWFVVVVLVLAMVTGVMWVWIDSSRAISNVVALLIVACPCALALATPLAIAVSIGRLAKRHVLVRSGDCLERLSKPGVVFFDKTGTLTEGRMRVSHWNGSSETLRAVAQIESGVQHPIARAISLYAHDIAATDAEPLPAATEVIHHVGRGVSGWYRGSFYQVGSLRLAVEDGLSLSTETELEIERMIADSSSPILVVRDGECVATAGVSDPLRLDAPKVVQALRRRGWEVEILSGDHHPSVSRVAAALNLDPDFARGGLLPEQKLAAIHSAIDRGPVIMVGDGVNDAAALAAADVGIAVRGGASASLAAAPIVIENGQLQGVLELIDGAKQTRRTIGRNFAISIGYNLLAVTFAMAGWITPLIAAALMPTSSLTVLGLTLATPKSTVDTSE